MNQHKITPLTESGLLAALTVVLALAAVYLPFIGMVAVLIWALPIIVLVVRHGLRWGIMAVIVAGIIMALLIEPMISLRMIISFAPTGLLLGYGFRQQWRPARIFGAVLGASLVGKLVALGLLFAITSINPLMMQVDILQESFDESFKLYESLGIDASDLEQSRNEVSQGMHMLTLLLPLVVIMMGVVDTVIGYLIGSRVLRRLGHRVNEFPPFAEWRLPRAFVYLFGFGLVSIYWGGSREIQPLYQFGLNANMVAIFAGLIQGLSLVHCVMRHYNLNTVVRVIIYVLLVMNGFFAQLIAMTGLIDMVFDYRTRLAGRFRK